MHSFLFAVGKDRAVPNRVIRTCCHVLEEWLSPRVGGLQTGVEERLGSGCAWCWSVPEKTRRKEVISWVSEPGSAALVFGDFPGQRGDSPARIVHEAWRVGGVRTVRELDGCFGAVLVDDTKSQVILLNDPTAQRRLFFYTDKEMLLVSPHDFMLAASGAFPLAWDTGAMASTLVVGWSVQGASYMQGVRHGASNTYIAWSNGSHREIHDPILDLQQTLDPHDTRSVRDNLNQMIELAGSAVREVVADRKVVRVELSAGADSRMVFGLALGASESAQNIVPVCVGGPACTDVNVAHRLCSNYGISFARTETVTPSAEEFAAEATRLAFAANGDANSNRLVLQPRQGYTTDDVLQLHGNGGEIYRGYYYPRVRGVLRPALGIDKARHLLTAKCLMRQPEGLDPQAAASMREKLAAALAGYEPLCRDGYDLLDLFYACERNAVWGQARSRMTWRMLWSPFNCVPLLRAAFVLPSPIGDPALLHREVIRRNVRKGYWTPVNGEWLMPLQRRNAISRGLDKLDRRSRRLQRRLRRHVSRRHGTSVSLDIEGGRRDALAGSLHDYVRPLLTDEAAVCTTLLGRPSIERLLEQHRNQEADHTVVLGGLVTIELWNNLVMEAHQRAEKL